MASRDFYSDGVERENWPGDLRDECARTALALTAFFDGEANDAEAALAEAHLANCANCAWLWQSWTRSRYVLQRMPVPAVPPGLLVRVLMAVRLMAFSQKRAPHSASVTSSSLNFEPQSGKARDSRLLAETVWMAGTNPFAPRRRNTNTATGGVSGAPRFSRAQDLPPLDSALPQPPTDLCARILSQTVQNVPSAAPVDTACEAVPCEAASITRRKSLWASSKTFSSALLPAAAAWLFLLARAPQLTENFRPVTLSSANKSSLTTPKRTQSRLSRKPVAMGNESRGRDAANDELDGAVGSFAAMPERTAQRVDNENVSVREAAFDAPRIAASTDVVAVETPAGQPTAGVNAGANTLAAPSPTGKAVVLTPPAVVKATRRAPAISVAPVAFRSRHALWSAPDVPTPDERATQWRAAPRHAIPPVEAALPRDEVDEAPDAAEIINHSARLTDSRPDDVADVVDDFRASLMAATADDAPANPDGENG